MKNITSPLLIATVLSLLVNALPQSLAKYPPDRGPAALSDPFRFYSRSLDDRNDYLTPLLEFERYEAQYTKSEPAKFIVPDLLAYLNAYIGRYDKALATQDKGWEPQMKFEPDLLGSKLDEYKPEPALDAIAKLAENHQVVMINEEHVTPQHRAFTDQLLPLMWAKGFRYFAAETFAENVTQMNSSSYPNQKSGFYSDDPVFGDMIRTALRLGFKLVPYEYLTKERCINPDGKPNLCQDQREQGQAQNLFERTLKVDQKAKVLVHVGRGHNQKLKMDDWAMMAWHFQEISGVEPLSVDQMHSERSEPRFETPIYRYAVKKWNITEPALFISKGGEYWKNYGQDVVVFHPRTRYKLGRPVWLNMGGLRKAVPIRLSSEKRNIAGPFLVQAFVECEGEDAIPMDQVVVPDVRSAAVLVLPKGNFRVRVIGPSGEEVERRKLTTK